MFDFISPELRRLLVAVIIFVSVFLGLFDVINQEFRS